MYPGRCALNPPLCTQKATKNKSKSHKKSLKIGSGSIPGALREGSGTILTQDGPMLEKGTKKPRNPSTSEIDNLYDTFSSYPKGPELSK